MDTLKVQFNFRFIVLFLGLSIIAIVAFASYKATGNIDDTISISAAGIALVSLIYIAMNLHLVAAQLRAATEGEKRKMTIDLLSDFMHDDYQRHALALMSVQSEIDKLEGKEKVDYFLAHPEKHEKVMRILNQLEYVCYLLNKGFVDEALVLDYLGDVFESKWSQFQGIVAFHRTQQRNNKICCELEEVVTKRRRKYS
ncbi:MAG: DUF4760 domain-containing protein [Candidatus Thiodiazotropha sp.]